MSRSSKKLIDELQRTRKFMGTCPSCQQDFSLADALLFSTEGALPEAALKTIQAIRDRIQQRRAELAIAKTRMTQRAQNTAAAVNLGKIVEKIVPSFDSFEYAPGDCRALFEPIDYLIFSGLSRRREVEAIHFVDVKSGSARLAAKQQEIKGIVDRGRVTFKVMRSGS